MEPLEVLGVAGFGAAAWALGRASRSWAEGGTEPGERVALIGARASRSVAFGAASMGSRALMLSAAGASLAGSVAARGVGMGIDTVFTVGDRAKRLGPRPRHDGGSMPRRGT